MNGLSSKWRSWIVPGILSAAFLVRLWGVGFGLPDIFHADEPIVVNHALAFGTGDLNPHFFKIPPLVSYLLFVCYGIYYVAGSLAGSFHSICEFEYLFYFDPSSFYLIARLVLGVFLGTASVYLLFLLVKRFWNQQAALWSGFFFALNFLHVRDSHYIYADIPLLFVLLLGFFFIFCMTENPVQKRWHLSIGAMIGLATAIKYNGIFLTIPYVWACLCFVPWKKWPGFWILVGIVALLTFLVLNPFAILDCSFFLREITQQSASNRGGSSWLHHLTYSLSGAMGWPMLVLALWGTLCALFGRGRKPQTVAVFVTSYYVVLCFFGQPYDRYVLPLIPLLLILATEVLLKWKERSRLVFWVLLPFLILPSLIKIIHWDRLMAAPDTRTVAKQWVEENIPDGSRLALDGGFYMPRLAFTPGQLEEKKSRAAEGLQAGAKMRRLEALLSKPHQPAYELYFLSSDPGSAGFLFSEPRVPFDMDVLRQKDMEYVFLIGGLRRGGDPFFQDLRANADLIATFSPYRNREDLTIRDPQTMTGGPFLWSDILPRERNGYPISIYRIRS